MGSRPAIAADTPPTIQVTRMGTRRVGCVLANHFGSRPSRLIANQTRVTPSMNVNITVRMPMMAATAMKLASPGRPTDSKAVEKPLVGLICR